IHRDIKPDNFLVSAIGDAKLADFGVARLPDAALTKERQFLGTPCYGAPETLAEARYGRHRGRFSFAAVLYERATAGRALPVAERGTGALAWPGAGGVPGPGRGRQAGWGRRGAGRTAGRGWSRTIRPAPSRCPRPSERRRPRGAAQRFRRCSAEGPRWASRW